MKLSKYKKVCVITGSRADYGILKKLIEKISEHPKLKLQLIATGSHLSKKYGYTVSEIHQDGFKVDKTIKIISNKNTSLNLVYNSAKALRGYADSFKKLKPDLVLLLGDRYEIFCAAYASVIFGIPIAHLHGGETTQNSYDEFFRHSITKLSQVHFVATETYKKRVMQLGESPKNIYNVGSVSLENIFENIFLNEKKLESHLKVKFKKKSLLITLHPETLNREEVNKQCKVLLSALSRLKHTTLIFTMPNSDINSSQIEIQIKQFCRNKKNAFFFKSLGRKVYFSCIKKVDAVIGNSSSGIIEVPSLKKPSIDIGKRQYGRVRSNSVLSCEFKKSSILKSIKKIYSKNFLKKVKYFKNPYYKKNSIKKVIAIINRNKLDSIKGKTFFDIKF